MLLNDLKVIKTKLENDIATEVIKLLKQFKNETGCDVEDVSFSFCQNWEVSKEPFNILTRVKVDLVI